MYEYQVAKKQAAEVVSALETALKAAQGVLSALDVESPPYRADDTAALFAVRKFNQEISKTIGEGCIEIERAIRDYYGPVAVLRSVTPSVLARVDADLRAISEAERVKREKAERIVAFAAQEKADAAKTERLRLGEAA